MIKRVKKRKTIVAFILVMLLQLTAFGKVKGSPHDLAALDTGDACSFCHTPHGALPQTPGWSHKLSSTVYKIYQSSSLDAKVGQPTGDSKLCLSCHDGTTDLDAAGTTIGTVNSAANVGENLSQSHPISFAYATSDAADDEIVAENATITALLDGGNVECSSCHDVHNAAGNAGLLQIDNSGSALCLTCHAK